jgi:hypothetical protein
MNPYQSYSLPSLKNPSKRRKRDLDRRRQGRGIAICPDKNRMIIRRYAAQLTSANRKLQMMSITDPLSGLPDRRSLTQPLSAAVTETIRQRDVISTA